MAEKLKIKSSISEVAQVLSIDADKNLIPSRGNMTVLDTADKNIFESIVLESVPEMNIGTEILPDGTLVVEPFTNSVNIGEPPPLSEFTMSNKVGVIFDRGIDSDDTKRLQFYYDHTPDNERIHMMHSSGTYFTMRPDGSEVHKVKDNLFNVIEGHSKNIIGGNYTLNIKGENTTFTSKGEMCITTSYDLIQSASGSLRLSADGDITMSSLNIFASIGGNVTYEVDQNFFIDSSGIIALKAKGGIILEAPEITYNIGKQTLLVQGEFNERTMGPRSISADGIFLSAQDGLNFFAGGDMEVTVTGNKIETVYGVSTSIPPSLDAYKLTINLGNYSIFANAGIINISTGALGVAAAGIEMTPVGTATLTALVKAVIDSKIIILGGQTGTEPAVLGQALFNWLKDHRHSHPQGMTDVPVQPPLPNILSKQVIIAG